MKIKLSWIILPLVLVSLAAYVVPHLKYWFPSAGPSASEASRPEQATPEAAVNAVFQTVDQGADTEDPKSFMDDRLDDAHLLEGKDMTPDEQRFASLFWDNRRSAAIYHYLRANLTRSAEVTPNAPTGDMATISVAAQVVAEHGSDWIPANFTVQLKKRGPNWYVDELKTSNMPNGVFATFQQRVGSLR
jgi:hypothetical protein